MIEWFSNLPFFTQASILYIIGINSITFFAFGFDKAKSRNHTSRTPEKTLWALSLLGGSPAALIAMNYFRHKTKKNSFQAIITLILILQIGSVVSLYLFLFLH